MKSESFDSRVDRSVLMAMILSDEVLTAVCQSNVDTRAPFHSKAMNMIAHWCSVHWAEYGKAPGSAIQDHFHQWSIGQADADRIEQIEKLLVGLDAEAKRIKTIDPQFLIDRAERLFKRVQAEKIAEQIEDAAKRDDPDAIDEAFAKERVQFERGEWISMDDPKDLSSASLEDKSDTLIKWPGQLGEFLSDQFCRDSFISFAGPEKRGKSFWLQEVVFRALAQKRRVVYYVVGDMSAKQVLKRFANRLTRRPPSPKVIEIPKRIRRNKKTGDPIVTTEEREFKDYRTLKEVSAALALFKKRTACKRVRLRLKVEESSVINVAQISQDLGNLVKQDWIPDVVVVDYADVLASEPLARHFDYRHQVNETWKALRAISQRYHCCVTTATQTAATSYDTSVIRRSDFSEDKRKAGHVTGMLGLNQTPDEKRQGVYRLNWLFLREGHWPETMVVTTAGNLSIGCPCIVSSFLRAIE